MEGRVQLIGVELVLERSSANGRMDTYGELTGRGEGEVVGGYILPGQSIRRGFRGFRGLEFCLRQRHSFTSTHQKRNVKITIGYCFRI